jgi:trehalose 6-phosphate phosphatase
MLKNRRAKSARRRTPERPPRADDINRHDRIDGVPYILAKRHAGTLAAFAAANVVAAFDYDGTLAPITADPESAPMRAETRKLLKAVADRYPCVVISGRRRADLAACLDGVAVSHLSGNHGAEPWGQRAGHRQRIKKWRSQLEGRLSSFPGVVLEDKNYSLTIHYRHARGKRKALAAIDEAVRALRGARSIPGKETVNLLPRNGVNKGDALERARALLRCDLAIYVGDDDTDEDAFVRARAGRLLGIRIGHRHRSKAAYYLRTQGEIDTFLQRLVELRPAQGGW